jgi:hypothetical protein
MFGIKTARAQAENAQTQAALARIETAKVESSARSEVTELSWQVFKLSRQVDSLGWQLCAVVALVALIAWRLPCDGGE